MSEDQIITECLRAIEGIKRAMNDKANDGCVGEDRRDCHIALAAVSASLALRIRQLTAALSGDAIDRKRFEDAPCYRCGYNGEGYFQADKHPCAKLYHGALSGDGEGA